MGNDSKYTKKGITPEKIMAFIESRSGKKLKDVGEEFGVTRQTIANWTGEILDYIRQSPEYKQVAPRLVAMIPAALAVYERRLGEPSPMATGNPDLIAAKDVMKMTAIMVERKESVNKELPSNEEELWLEIGDLIHKDAESPNTDGDQEAVDGDQADKDAGEAPVLPTPETPRS